LTALTTLRLFEVRSTVPWGEKGPARPDLIMPLILIDGRSPRILRSCNYDKSKFSNWLFTFRLLCIL
jgi:hypothetical protein